MARRKTSSKLHPRYPHLLPEDALVWDRFLLGHPFDSNSFEYDVQVGRGRPYPGPASPGIHKMALDLSRRRIDVVGHTPTCTKIYEVTRQAGLTAVGQLIAYPILYAKTYDPPGPCRPVLVCEELQSDIETVLLALRIEYHTLGPPESDSEPRSQSEQ
jgi:hypothetical protein